jgi:hypothetical protein
MVNPCTAEGVRASLKTTPATPPPAARGRLAAIVKNQLKRTRDRPELINGFLAQGGLNLEPEPPRLQTLAFQGL